MNYYIGIDMGGTNTKIGIIDENEEIIFSDSIKTESAKGIDYTIKNISNKIDDLLKKHSISIDDVLAIGIGVPGPIQNKSTVKIFSNFNWGNDVNLLEHFKKYYNKPIYIDNDVNVITLGEIWKGVGKGYKNIVGIAIGTGIGAGIIIDGKPVSGKNGFAGEIGHIVIDKTNPRKCGCKKDGCFEANASAVGIVKIALEDINNNKDSKLYKIYEDKKEIEAKDVFDLARENDEYAKKIVDIVCDNFAMGIATSINLLDPELIILGGGVSLAGDMIIPNIKDKLKKYTFDILIDNLEIKKSILGNDAGIYGAVYLAKIYTD